MNYSKKESLDTLFSLLTSSDIKNHKDFSDGTILVDLLNKIKEYSNDTEYPKPLDRFFRIEDIINTCYNLKSEEIINYSSVISSNEIDSEIETYALCLMVFGVCLLSSKQSEFMKLALTLNSTMQAELMQMTSAIIQPNSLHKSNLLVLQHSLSTINENGEWPSDCSKNNSLSVDLMNQSGSQTVTPPLSVRNSFAEDSCSEVQQLLQSDCPKSLFCSEEMHWSFSNNSPHICPPSPLTPLQNFLNSPHIQLRTLLREKQRDLKAKQREVLAERQLRIEAEEELVEVRSQIDQLKATNRDLHTKISTVETNLNTAEANLVESNEKLLDLEKKDNEIKRLREKLIELRDTKEQISIVEKHNQELLCEREELLRKLMSMEDMEKSLENLSSAETELRELKLTLVEAEVQIKQLVQERDDAVKSAEEAKQHCCELQTELSDIANKNYMKNSCESGVNLAVDIKLVDLEQELQAERKLRLEWEQKYRAESHEREALQKSTNSLIKELEELRAIANDKNDLRNHITRLMEDKTAINKDLSSLRDDKKALTIMKKELESKLHAKERNIEELNQQHCDDLSRLNKTICNYQDEVKQMEIEMYQLRENLKTTESLLSEVERAKRVAEDEKNAETVRCEAAILAIQTDCTEEISAMREELESTRESLANEVIELNSRLEKSANHESDLERSVTELNENLQHEVSDRSRLETELEQLAAELSKMEGMRESIMVDCENEVKQKVYELEKRLEAESIEVSRLQTDREDILHYYRAQKTKLEERLDSLHKSFETKEQQYMKEKKALLHSLESQKTLAQEYRNSCETQFHKLKEELADAERRVDLNVEPLLSEIEQLKKQQISIASIHEDERASLKSEIDQLKNRLDESNQKYDSVVVDFSLLKSENNGLNERLAAAEIDKQNAVDDLNKARSELEEFSESIENLIQVEKKFVEDRNEWRTKEKELLDQLTEAKQNAIDGTRLQEDSDEIQRLKLLNFELEEKLETLTSTNKRLQGQLQSLDRTNESLSSMKKLYDDSCSREREANTKVKHLQTDLQRVTEKLDKQKDCLEQDAKLREERLRTDIKNAQNRISSMQSRIQTLDEENASLEMQEREWRLHAQSQDEHNKSMENELQHLRSDLETKSFSLSETLHKLQNEQYENDRNHVKISELEKELSLSKHSAQEAHNELMSLKVKLASLEAKELVQQGIRDRQHRLGGQDVMPPPGNVNGHYRRSSTSSASSLNTYILDSHRYKEPANNTNNSYFNDSIHSYMESSRTRDNHLPEMSPVFSRDSNGQKSKLQTMVSASGDGSCTGKPSYIMDDQHPHGALNDGTMSEFSELTTSRFTEYNDEGRVRELLRRNKSLPVHMRTCYPVETQVINPRDMAAQISEDDPLISVIDDPSISEDLIRSGPNSGIKPRRKHSMSIADSHLKSSLRTELSSETKKEKLAKDTLSPKRTEIRNYPKSDEYLSNIEKPSSTATMCTIPKSTARCCNKNDIADHDLVRRNTLVKQKIKNENVDIETVAIQQSLLKLHQRCTLMKQILNKKPAADCPIDTDLPHHSTDIAANDDDPVNCDEQHKAPTGKSHRKRSSGSSDGDKVVLKFSKHSSKQGKEIKSGASGYTPKNIRSRLVNSRYHHCCKSKLTTAHK